MSNTDSSLHIYQRTVGSDDHDSLSVIAQMIQPGQTLLDLGMGTGGLGKYLSHHQPIVADGITLNQAEANIAKEWYRNALVADLDQDNIETLFGTNRYDCIVCADVLEHLKNPQNLLTQCVTLLKPGGRLLTSVPNASYCGLVAELVQGDFRYRQEGLLDNTHLRFFTRKSLKRFFDENGWATQSTQITTRSLLASEFRVAFDTLPPAVARYLLALPDALTYQFISVLQPASAAQPSSFTSSENDNFKTESLEPANALFSAQLYLAVEDHYNEAKKLVAPGRIGEPLQTLVFNLPACQKPYTRVRLDPADRPGFFKLHYMRLWLPDGTLAWQWQAGQDPLAIFINAPQHDMVISAPWEMSTSAMFLLHGEDPWVELPLASDLLQKIARSGAKLEVCAGWPMSADYLQASMTINTLQAAHEQSHMSLTQENQRINKQQVQFEQTLHVLQTQLTDANQAMHSALSEKQALISELDSVRHQTQAEEQRLTGELQTTRQIAQTEKQRLITDLHALQQEAQTEKQRLTNELRTTQRARNLAQDQFNQIALHVQSIERSTMFRVTRPLSHMKGRVDRLLGRGAPQGAAPQPGVQAQAIARSVHPVDIIVPVYRGLEDTRRCLESVLAAPGKTVWRLIVINDCSPEPEVTEWLRAFAQRDPRIQLLENPENLGFVGTVNRGMALSADNDVLLLNSDAEVANDWLDRIQSAGYSAPRVASVTPFSNNATICSYPRFCQVNDLPDGFDTASMDRLFARHLAGQSVAVPTGVGFCMYIRRQCLQDVGLFDVANFGKGYGEENDFCIRAEQAGWTNLHALDTFVRHAGGISFGDSKSERELAAMQTIRRLHPGYESDVHAYVQRDPVRQARMTIDIARIIAGGLPVVLLVMHNREGGTLRHIQELAGRLSKHATFLRLTPAPGGVELRLEGKDEAFVLHFALPDDHHRLVQTLRQLHIGHIHYHHLLGHVPEICDLPAKLGVTHDFTAHDYYSYCPQISLTDHTDRYCGEQGLEQCHSCLKHNPAPGAESIESWRARHSLLLSQARHVIAPSMDTAKRIQRFVPTSNILVVPHASLALSATTHPQPNPRPLRNGQPLKIVVLGALGKIKGADLLEAVSILAARQNAQVEFHLLGYAYRSLRIQPKALLTVHGSYKESDLPALLNSLAPDAVWFPAQCPETYSYTLSACLELGLPVIAPNLGAFPDRLIDRGWTWVCPWDQTAEQWLQLFDKIRIDHFQTGIAPQASAEIADEHTVALASQHYAKAYQITLESRSNASVEEVSNLAENFLNTSVQQQTQQHTARIKGLALRWAIRLRASPMLSGAVHRLPAHLQRRVKSWLQS